MIELYNLFENLKQLLNSSTEKELHSSLLKILSQIFIEPSLRIYMYDPQYQELISIEDSQIRVPVGAGLIGMVFEEKLTLDIPRASKEDEYIEEIDKIGDWDNLFLSYGVSEDTEIVLCINYKKSKWFVSSLKNNFSVIADITASIIRRIKADTLSHASLDNIIESIAWAIDNRSVFSMSHTLRVWKICEKIGRALEYSQEKLDLLKKSVLLHDIGRLYLNYKAPQEFINDTDHVLYTESILRRMKISPSRIIEIVGSHHEYLDGSGYPEGKLCDEIPFESRIIAIADYFDMNVYVLKRKEQDVKREMLNLKGKKFDPAIMDIAVEKECFQKPSRQFERITTDATVDIKIVNISQEISGKVVDISEGGIGVRVQAAIPEGSLVRMNIYIGSNNLDAIGKVVRCKKLEEDYLVGMIFIWLEG